MNYLAESEVLETLAPTRRRLLSTSCETELIRFNMPESSPSSVSLLVFGSRAEYQSSSNVGHAYERSEQAQSEIVKILNEPFTLEDRGGRKVLKHRQWSLMGSGATKAQAIKSLQAEAEEVADFFLSQPDETLTDEAVGLKHFLKKLVA